MYFPLKKEVEEMTRQSGLIGFTISIERYLNDVHRDDDVETLFEGHHALAGAA
jgi:hypothetical protein